MTYPHAPITEAVIDIRVAPRDGLAVDDLRAIGSKLGPRYPQTRDQIKISGAMVVGTPPGAATMQNATTVEHSKVGFQFVAATGDRLFNAQLDGCSFNKLAPYESWERFQAEGRELWSAYRRVVEPSSLTRVALRYVNRLDLPLPFDDFRKYLNTAPEVGSGMPQGLSNYFMQLQIPYDELEAMVILNTAMIPAVREGVVSIVLDIDIFRTQNVPQDEDSLWAFAERLRHAKNAIFEASITDATRELFV